MRRVLVSLFFLLAHVFASAEQSWLGIYMQGSKIGYVRNEDGKAVLNGKPVSVLTSETVTRAQVLGQEMLMSIVTRTYSGKENRPTKFEFETKSAGRSQKVEAIVRSEDIFIKIDNSGKKSNRTIKIPSNVRLVADSATWIDTLIKMPIGKAIDVYTLDPVTLSLVRNRLIFRGKERVVVHGQEYVSNAIDIVDPRLTMRYFSTAKGDLIKIEGPLGMEMFPEPKKQAMSFDSEKGATDIVMATTLKPDPSIKDPEKSTYMKIKVSGLDLSNLPSDKAQQVIKIDGAWVIVNQPLRPTCGASIDNVALKKPEWIVSDTNMPTDDPAIKELAALTVGETADSLEAATRIKNKVHQMMRTNASIGMLRDATEILKTKEGVCRDYAILTATLMRAARIPARLVTGIVYADGVFFYHAWVEAWLGDEVGWVGFDSTREAAFLSATHIKLRQGRLEDAFTFFLLDKARLKVLEVRYD